MNELKFYWHPVTSASAWCLRTYARLYLREIYAPSVTFEGRSAAHYVASELIENRIVAENKR